VRSIEKATQTAEAIVCKVCGTTAVGLGAKVFDAHSLDPVVDQDRPFPTPGAFILLRAFEVSEHSPTPVTITLVGLSFLRANGRLVFSTFVIDEVRQHAIGNRQIAPRNGHISLHTSADMPPLLGGLAWTVRSSNANLQH
jgi:hypothetical protein